MYIVSSLYSRQLNFNFSQPKRRESVVAKDFGSILLPSAILTPLRI